MEKNTITLKSDRFLFVGDLHCNDTTPSSRTDDYSEATIAKLRWLIGYAQGMGIELIVVGGDIFHKTAQSLTYLNRLVEVLREASSHGIMITSVIGNHDIHGENMDSFKRSPLYTLYASGLLLLPKLVKLQGAEIRYFDYLDEISPIVGVDSGTTTFCVAHEFFDMTSLFGEKHNISKERARELGYDCYLLGHDHSYYGVERFPKGKELPKEVTDPREINGKYFYTVGRCGAFTRGTSKILKEENDKPIIFRVSLKDGSYSVSDVEVAVAKSKAEVFDSMHKDDLKNEFTTDSVAVSLSQILIKQQGGIKEWLVEWKASDAYSEAVYNDIVERLRKEGTYL